MKKLFFLGAGASVEAGIPIASEMTERIYEQIAGGQKSSKSAKVLKFIIGGLLFLRGSKEQNPYEGISIEDLLDTIDLLSERDKSELNPFIASWHPLLNELELGEISPKDMNKFLRLIYSPLVNSIPQNNYSSRKLLISNDLHYQLDFNITNRNYEDIGEQLQKIIRQALGSKATRSFSLTRDTVTKALIDIVWLKKGSFKGLNTLVDYCNLNHFSIFTLNYDNSIELSSKNLNIPFCTGVRAWSRTRILEFPENMLKIVKLHGSINWALSEFIKDGSHPIEYQEITELDDLPEIRKRLEPAIIFGGKNKLTAKGPFLALLRAFEEELECVDELIVIGYSFRDEHINAFIGNWINKNINNIITVINPSFNEADALIFEKQLGRLPNERIRVIKEKAETGIYKLFNEIYVDQQINKSTAAIK